MIHRLIEFPDGPRNLTLLSSGQPREESSNRNGLSNRTGRAIANPSWRKPSDTIARRLNSNRRHHKNRFIRINCIEISSHLRFSQNFTLFKKCRSAKKGHDENIHLSDRFIPRQRRRVGDGNRVKIFLFPHKIEWILIVLMWSKRLPFSTLCFFVERDSRTAVFSSN